MNDDIIIKTEDESLTAKREDSFTAKRVVYYFLGVLEVLFAFRLVFKLLEPSTIIAMIVYALIAWGIVKLIIILRERNEDHV